MNTLTYTATSLASGERLEAAVAAINRNGMGMDRTISDNTSMLTIITYNDLTIVCEYNLCDKSCCFMTSMNELS